MAIENIEIRDINRVLIGIIDTAKSIIWHSKYSGVGDFEIYAPATPEIISMLQIGNYVMRNNEIEVGVIEKTEINYSLQNGFMIAASGRFIKSVLNRRLIYKLTGKSNKPTILTGNVEKAVRDVVNANAISAGATNSARNIPVLALGALSNLPAVIVDENGNPAQKQVSYQNLFDYSEEILKEYGYAATCIFDLDTTKFLYTIYAGVDRSTENTAGNSPVIFSREFDNLSDTNYIADDTAEKNTALIGGEGEGLLRFYALLDDGKTALARREMWVDASSLSQTLTASELLETFPTGVFTGLQFKVGNVVYANLVTDLTREYSLSSLQDKFPNGTTSGTKFLVSGVVYANKKYGDDNDYLLTALGYKAMLDKDGQEGSYLLTDAVYTNMLKAQGKTALAPLNKVESFSGSLILSNSPFKLNEDFFLGDLVTVQDNQIGKYAKVRISEITEVQDENGYTVNVFYE